MAWTYSGNPASSPSDAVRFEVGDTDEKRPMLSDEEIAYVLKRTGGHIGTAALAAISNVMAKLARCVDETVGPVSRSFSQRLSNLEKIRADLTTRLAVDTGSAGYVGGISLQDIRSNDADADWAKPAFSEHFMVGSRDGRGNGIASSVYPGFETYQP